MTDCQLTHFELSSGLLPSCSGPRGNDDLDFHAKVTQMINTNEPQNLTLGVIYGALRWFSLKSLQVFFDADFRTKTFNDLTPSWSLGLARRRPSFPQMKLLVLRLKNIHELLDENQRPDDHFCRFVPENTLPDWRHHHSVWRYLSIRYASFHDCDCIVVETGWHGSGAKTYRSLWELAAKMFLDHTYRIVKKIGACRYFIIGNSIDGYSGIERDMHIGYWIDHSGKIRWGYKELENETCKRVLLERGFLFG